MIVVAEWRLRLLARTRSPVPSFFLSRLKRFNHPPMKDGTFSVAFDLVMVSTPPQAIPGKSPSWVFVFSALASSPAFFSGALAYVGVASSFLPPPSMPGAVSAFFFDSVQRVFVPPFLAPTSPFWLRCTFWQAPVAFFSFKTFRPPNDCPPFSVKRFLFPFRPLCPPWRSFSS